MLVLALGVIARCVAGTGNIAPFAKITASTSLSKDYDASKVTDGWIGIDGKGEYYTTGYR